MKTFRQMISLVAALAMLVGLIPLSAMQAVAADDATLQTAQLSETDSVLELNVTKHLSLAAGEEAVYSFVPQEDGVYVFYAESESDTYGYLLDAAMEEIDRDDDGGDGANFRITSELVAGQTYYIKAEFYYSGDSGDLSLTAIQLVPAQSISITQEEPIEGYPLDEITLSVAFAPENAIEESYTWTSSDTSVATVNAYGTVSLVAAGTATITVTSENGLTDSIGVTVNAFPVLTLNEIQTVDITQAGEAKSYIFTPEEDGWYALYSTSEMDTYARLYNLSGSYLDSDGDSGDGDNFRLEYNMTAGESYILKVEFDSSSTVGSFDLAVEKMVAAEAVSIVEGDTLFGYVYAQIKLTAEFSPVGCVQESLSWVSSDESVATVDSYGTVTLHSLGEAVITVTSENGLTDQCTIQVVEYPTISVDETKTVEITGVNKDAYFSFIPQEDGVYAFYSSSESDTYAWLLDGEGTEITRNDDDGEGNNFWVEYSLVAGETYIYKCSFLNSGAVGTFDVQLVKLAEPERLEIVNGDTLAGYIGSSSALGVEVYPENHREVTVSWSSSDDTVVSVASFGSVLANVEMLKEGTATITVTADNGITDTIEVTVADYPVIELDETKTVEFGQTELYGCFQFTPAEDGVYNVAVNSDYYTQLSVKDTNGNRIGSERGYSFAEGVELTAGVTYYVQTYIDDDVSACSYTVSITTAPAATSMDIYGQDSQSVYVGDSDYLWVNYKPEDCVEEVVTWTCDNSSVATINQYGDVSFVGAGTATIIATSENGLTDSVTYNVSVRPAATALKILNGARLTGYIGDSTTITVDFEPADCVAESVTWSSDNLSVATVSEYGNASFVGVGTATITVTSENGLTDSCVIEVKEIPAIVCDEEKRIYATSSDNTALFAFVPNEDGVYSFFSYDNDMDTYGHILDSDMNVLISNDDDGDGSNFKASYTMTAGETYYLKARPYSSGNSGTYYVKVIRLVPATSVTILGQDTISIYEGVYYGLEAELNPENSIEEDFTWSSSDESVATVGLDGHVQALAVGTATITVTTESGLSDSVELTVLAAEEIALNENKIGVFSNGAIGSSFAFTPTEDGVYKVHISGGHYVQTYVYDASWNQSAQNSGYYFAVECAMNAGETYCIASSYSSNNEDGVYNISIEKLVPATSFDIIDGESISGYVDNSYYLDTMLMPENAISEDITWTSSDPAIATVSSGWVYFHSIGTAVITATSENGLSDSITVNVVERPKATSMVIADSEYANAHLGIDTDLWVEFSPHDASSESVTWTSDNTDIATVDENGVVSFASVGTVTITATSENGLTDSYSLTAKEWDDLTTEQPVLVTIANNKDVLVRFIPAESGNYRIYVADISNDNEPYFELYDFSMDYINSTYDGYMDFYFEAGETYYIATDYHSYSGQGNGTYTLNAVKLVAAEGVEINPESVVGCEGYTYTFDVEYSPSNSINEAVFWESSDPAVVRIDEYGKVMFVSAGTATITATTENGLADTATVTVTAAQTLLLNEETIGTVDETVVGSVFKFVPDETGYYVFDLSSDFSIYTHISDSEGDNLDYDYGYNLKFKQLWLIAGETYYVGTSNRYEGNSGDYTVCVEKMVPATSFEIDDQEMIYGYVGDTYWLSLGFSPENAIAENVVWRSSDPSIAYIQSGEYVRFISPGTVTITAVIQNGLTDSITVTTLSIPDVVLNEVNTVEIIEGINERRYTFTPSETGAYSFDITSEYDVYFGIYDEYDNYVVGSNDSFKCYLTANETYYIKTYFYNGNIGSYTFVVTETAGVRELEITQLPDRMLYYKGFEEFDYYGMKIKATFEDGSVVDWNYNYSGSINGFDVDVENNYFGGHYVESVVSCGGATVSFAFDVQENPVDHLEIVSGTAVQYIENYNGYTYNNNFIYYTYYPSDAVVKIVYKDGTSAIANVGGDVQNYGIEWEHHQGQDPWVVGTDNRSTVSYLGYTVNLPITVVQNLVESIEVVSGKVVCIENAYGYALENGFYIYDYEIPSDVVVKINYTNGTSKTVNFYDTVDGYNFGWGSNQYETPWTLGDNNSLTISYLGVSAQLPVSVIPNPVDRIVINQAPTREYIYGDEKYGYSHSDGYELYPTDLTGLSFTVYYTDGTSKTFTDQDIEGDRKIDGYRYSLQYAYTNVTVGDFPVTFHYMGKSANYTVVLKESEVASIAVTKQPNKTVFEDTYSPDFVGMDITITYTDGSTKVVPLTESNLQYDYSMWADTFSYEVDVDGHTLTIGTQQDNDGTYYVARYLDATCEIGGITFTQSKSIQAVEVDDVSWNGEGMIVYVTYTDGTNETITLDGVGYYEQDNTSVYGYATSDKGLFSYYIETVKDANENIMQYEVSIFGETITITTATFVKGDVNADGVLNTADARYVLSHIIGTEGQLTAEEELYANMNEDDVIDSSDVRLMLDIIADRL